MTTVSQSRLAFSTLLRISISGRPAALSRPCLLPVQLHASLIGGRSRRDTRTHILSLTSIRKASNMATSADTSSSSKGPLLKRSVVSSFLYKFVQENGERKAKVALFKRSGQVRTYP